MPEPISWTCVVCREPIENGEGALGIDPHTSVPDLPADEDGTVVLDFTNYEPPAPWSALHYDCTRHGQTDDEGHEFFDNRFTYAIQVGELRTVGQLLRWTIHVTEKSWVSGTDFRDVVRAAADRAGVPEVGF